MTLRCFGDQLYTGLTRPDPSRSLKTPFYVQVFFPNLIFSSSSLRLQIASYHAASMDSHI